MCDISGILGKDSQNLNWMQKKMVEVTNLEGKKGTLADALNGADIFVGVSAPNIVTKEMVASMNKDAILFAMANPCLLYTSHAENLPHGRFSDIFVLGFFCLIPTF